MSPLKRDSIVKICYILVALLALRSVAGVEVQRTQRRLPMDHIQQHRHRKFQELDESCQVVSSSILKGPSHIIKNLTDPSIYDMKKRPNTAPVNQGEYKGREAITTPDNVTFGFGISSLDKVNMFDQEVVISLFELTYWQDYRLAYDISDSAQCVVGSGLTTQPLISLSDSELEGDYERLWLPDTYIVNSRSKEILKERLAFVIEDGRLFHARQKTITLSCPMHFGSYPYSTIECVFEVSSFGQTMDEVHFNFDSIEFKPVPHLVDLTTYMTNYEVGAFTVKKNTRSWVASTDSYRQTMYGTITLEHNPGSFWASVLIPDFLLHLAITSSFFISSDAAPARVTVCIIALLTFRVLMSSLYDQLPSVSYSLWVIDFMVASQIMAVGALVHYALVQYFLNTEESKSHILSSLTESQVLQIIDSGKMTISELLTTAVEKNERFQQVSKKAIRSELEHDKNFIKRKWAEFRKPTSRVTPMTDKSKKKEVRKSVHGFGVDRIFDRGSSISKLTSNVDNDFDGKLGITDVLNIITIKEIFNQFDFRDEGVITPLEFQLALRHFGYFYSHLQVCAMLEAFWQHHGTSLERHSDIDLETFLRLLIGRKQFEPFRDLNKVWFERKPSMICDILARFGYPVVYIGRCFIFWLMLNKY